MDRENENKLLKCKSLNEFSTMFFGYGINEQLSNFDESMIIKAGTSLYRARKDNGKTNFYDSKQWTMPPAKYVKQGRLNEKNKPVLYVASDEYLCGREILNDYLSVFYIGRLIKNLYDVTNKIGHLILRNNENGIRYSSVFEPIELSGGNVILTLYGEERKYKQEHDLSLMIEVFAQEMMKK